MFGFDSLANCYNSQHSFGRAYFRVHWGHVRGHGKRSRKMLTVDMIIQKNRLSYPRFLVSTYMKCVQILWSMGVSVNDCSFLNICNICRVISARAVGRAWTGNSQTDSSSNRIYASLATGMFPLPWFSVYRRLRRNWWINNLHTPFMLLL